MGDASLSMRAMPCGYGKATVPTLGEIPCWRDAEMVRYLLLRLVKRMQLEATAWKSFSGPLSFEPDAEIFFSSVEAIAGKSQRFILSRACLEIYNALVSHAFLWLHCSVYTCDGRFVQPKDRIVLCPEKSASLLGELQTWTDLRRFIDSLPVVQLHTGPWTKNEVVHIAVRIRMMRLLNSWWNRMNRRCCSSLGMDKFMPFMCGSFEEIAHFPSLRDKEWEKETEGEVEES